EREERRRQRARDAAKEERELRLAVARLDEQALPPEREVSAPRDEVDRALVLLALAEVDDRHGLAVAALRLGEDGAHLGGGAHRLAVDHAELVPRLEAGARGGARGEDVAELDADLERPQLVRGAYPEEVDVLRVGRALARRVRVRGSSPALHVLPV